MIRFDNWIIEAEGEGVVARQFDNLTGLISVTGDIPDGWDWAMLVQVGEAMDILPLSMTADGLSAVLTAEQLSVAGYYTMQLKATQGDKVRHTNTISTYISASLSGDVQWPVVPSAFSDLERRITEKAQQAESYATHSPVVGENGNWWQWNGEEYVDTGRPVQGVQGPQGEQGPQGVPGELSVQQGNLFYANALKGTASGEMFRLDDVSPLGHTVSVRVSGVDDPSAVKVYRLGKNLCPTASVTTKQDHSGRVYLKAKDYPWVVSHGRYTFSADVTVYPEDAAALRWFDFNIYYEDVTYDLGRIKIEDVETLRDGVTRHYSVTKKTNSAKKITQLLLVPLSHDGSSSTARNAKAENIQLELSNTETAYEPYVKAVTYPVNEDGSCEIVSKVDMTLGTDTLGAVMDCEYNKDINKAFEQLTQAIISMGGNI